MGYGHWGKRKTTQIICLEKMVKLWNDAEVININQGAGKVMDTGEMAKLHKSLHKDSLSRLWGDAKIIEINRGAGRAMSIGKGQKYANCIKKNLKAMQWCINY